jgi:zinc transport system permease protein
MVRRVPLSWKTLLLTPAEDPMPSPLLTALLAQADTHWLARMIDRFTELWPEGSFFAYHFNVQALLALILVSLSCGAVGSLVVGSRMAFFSDALAHCAFAGVSVGFVFCALFVSSVDRNNFWQWVTPIMVVFGALVAYGIVFVRLRTALASDTVIGVFFCGAIGLAAVLRNVMNSRNLFNMEDFLFGNPLLVSASDLVYLGILVLITFGVLAALYNPLHLTGFNSSLALSRRTPIALSNYVFVILLALIVNLCLRYVGALLINALLIVPAATAINLSRNLRQLFHWTWMLCLFISLSGLALSSVVEYQAKSHGVQLKLGISGTIVLLSVFLFVGSLFIGPWLRRRPAA